ncbi:MAG: hypothetical protein ACRES4_04410, partial [Nevskiales bacterium]
VYLHGGKKFERDAFWCEREGDAALPVRESAQVEEFRSAFGLRRTLEPGLSLVVPFPQDFDADEAVKIVVSEFYFPIAMGRLEVCIGDVDVRANNIDAVADHLLSDQVVRERGSCFTKGFRTFVSGAIADLKASLLPRDEN